MTSTGEPRPADAHTNPARSEETGSDQGVAAAEKTGVEPSGSASDADNASTGSASAEKRARGVESRDADGGARSRRRFRPRAATGPRGRSRERSSRSFVAVTALALVATIAAATMGILWATDDSADQLADLRSGIDADAAAEQAASTYALNVSKVDSKDLEAWRKALRTNVTEQLAPKLNAAVDVVGPWLSQVEYSATARVLAAKVQRREGDLYVVQVFVDMNSRSRQTPEGVTATATYTVTLNRAADWTITDVGGVTPDVPVKSAATPAAPAK